MTGFSFKSLAAFALALAAIHLFSQTGGVVLITSSSKELSVQNLKSDPNGGIEFISSGKTPVKLAPGNYIYAWVPKPAEISAADQDILKYPEKALKSFAAAEEKYKYLGWNIYCMAGRAQALAKINRLRDAIVLLEHASQYKLFNPRQKAHRDLINRLNVTYRLDLKDYAGAEKLMREPAQDPKMAAFYSLKKGVIRLEQKKTQEALTCFLITAFLYPETPDAPQALYEISQILASKKDPRASQFHKMLIEKYPNFVSGQERP